MLDIKFIRENKDAVKKNVSARNMDIDVERLLEIDKKRRALIAEVENLRAEQNKVSAQIAGEKDKEAKNAKIEETRLVKEKISGIEPDLKSIEEEFNILIFSIPNMADPDVPAGKDESENVVLREVGEKPNFDFEPKEHWQIGEELDIIDIPRAGKVAGARFSYLKGRLAILEFALIQYAYSVLTDEKILREIIDSAKLNIEPKPFMPVIPPVFIKPEVFSRMARLEPKEERYYIPSDDLFLVGSAEHTLGSLHMDEVLEESDLPVRYAGFSTAFRREAGSYGKDTKGILRVHQFDKLEIESFSLPEKSRKEQDFIVAIQEYLMRSLSIPYRVVMICTGDMGAPDARQIDIEAWLPGQGRYRETNTSDLNTDYQARRLNTRVKKSDGKMEFVHMNDATVFAVGRTLIAILENYQQKDGSIIVPDVLKKYAGFEKIEKK